MLFLLSCLSLLLQDKYSEVWPRSVSKRWEKNRKTKRKLKGNMSVTTEAENLEGAGTKISVRQREFCWFTPAAGLAWWCGRGRAGETDQKLWWWGVTSNPSLLNVTWFSRELALSTFGNQAFSGESSWDIQKSEYARELATVESIAKIYKYICSNNRNARGERCIYRKKNNLSDFKSREIPGCGRHLLAKLHTAAWNAAASSCLRVPAVRDPHPCYGTERWDYGQVHPSPAPLHAPVLVQTQLYQLVLGGWVCAELLRHAGGRTRTWGSSQSQPCCLPEPAGQIFKAIYNRWVLGCFLSLWSVSTPMVF